MEPVGDQDRAGQGVGDGLGVGRGQVDTHVGDRLPPPLGLLPQPIGDGSGGTPVDVPEQAAGASGVDDPGQPPIGDDPPPAGERVLGPDRFAAAGLIDPQDRHQRQRGRELGIDARDVRGVRHWPGHSVAVRGRLHARSVGRDPFTTLHPQPRGQPRPSRHRRQGLGERPPRAGLFTAPPPGLVPHQPDRRLTIGNIPRTRRGASLHRRRNHSAVRTRRRPQLIGDHRNDPATTLLEIDRGDR